MRKPLAGLSYGTLEVMKYQVVGHERTVRFLVWRRFSASSRAGAARRADLVNALWAARDRHATEMREAILLEQYVG